MAALPMPHEIGLETERLLSTAWDLATVTPIVPPVVVFISQIDFIKHIVALRTAVGWAWLIVRWWSRRKADIQLKI